ncbi:MAG TPA: T9SS type A sorting domain-containing protein [Saprospiraceae bacterium]|nr:T9SS type A sorting domain-containing protein [Saprospiraceae bacterium]
MKKYLLVLSGFLFSGVFVAQPVNDNCIDAIVMDYAGTEAELVLVSGDTRGGTPDSSAGYVCSGTWWYDDVWFSVVMPPVIPSNGIIVRAYFGTENDDVPAVGMGFYASCDSSAIAFSCFSTDTPDLDSLSIHPECLEPNTTYVVRIWSGVSADGNSGTFRIGAFANPHSGTTDHVLWEETFSDGLEGWTTFGFCGGNSDSSMNAVWHYLPDGLLDDGSFASPGVGINSPTVCNGAIGVDSDYDDNFGNALRPDGMIDPDAYGTGPCPVGDGSQYLLVSPSIPHGAWGVEGITLTWVQCIRQFQSQYFVSYRTHSDGSWGGWHNFQVNQEFPNDDITRTDDRSRVFFGGAEEGDSLQIRFVYNANYYFWGIDDIRLVETECINMRSMSNWYAIAPAVNTPVEQVVPWWPLNDVYNAGACTQTNVNLNFRLVNSDGQVIYNQNLDYGSLPADELVENMNFSVPVIVPNGKFDTYTGTYTVTSDDATEESDYDFGDNMNAIAYRTTEDLFALETGATRAIAVNDALYDAQAPLSYAYGNYFYFPKGDGEKLVSVTWGVSNPSDVAGIPLNLILYKWSDANHNEIAESSEREIVGFATHTFDGTEPDDMILETALETFFGADVLFEDNAAYLMMIEYYATDRTLFFLLSSEQYNYGAVMLSALQAGTPTYASVLGFSPDGNLQDIDYEVTERGDPNRVYFGWNIVPLVRLNIDFGDGVEDVLPEENIVGLYPNPAFEKVNFDLEFTQKMERVQIIMSDVFGRSVWIEHYRDIEKASLEFNVAKLPPGAYTVQVSTERGSRAIPLMVQH